jgi:hypothetical protein
VYDIFFMQILQTLQTFTAVFNLAGKMGFTSSYVVENLQSVNVGVFLHKIDSGASIEPRLSLKQMIHGIYGKSGNIQ